MMNLEFKLVVEQRLVLNGCLDWIATAANNEIQVSVVGLTYYWVLSLEKIKTNQAAEIEKLKKRVKKLEGKKKKRTHGLKRMYKVGLSARIVSSDEEAGENVKQDAIVAKKEVSTDDPVTTTGDVVTTARGVEEPEKPLKKKDQIALDEEVARKFKAQMKVEIEEEESITRKKDEANIAMIEQ
nr:hypothetical protein [Tanacetum cinerariifolium]